uniref:CHHC U11-48K-type domain-containing protein n=1 Tax=Phasianus colchicus TaxID=9054 RepID=A0A669QAM6_PHACC
MDPEALVQCPYDKAHQIRVSRLPYHLVKCQRNNPQVARSMEICPFNARHRIPRAELQRHIACCPDQRLLFDSQGTRPATPQLQHGTPHSDTRPYCALCVHRVVHVCILGPVHVSIPPTAHPHGRPAFQHCPP